MNKTDVIEKVCEYVISNEKSALLINGVWGSGKTYLYKNHLVDAINKIERGKIKLDEIISNLSGGGA